MWLVAKLTKKESGKSGKRTLISIAVSVISFAIAVSIGNGDPKTTPVSAVQTSKTDAKEVKVIDQDLRAKQAFMNFDMLIFKSANVIISNETGYKDFAGNIDKYTTVDAYNNVKSYRETLMQNRNSISGIDISKELPKDVKTKMNGIKSDISNALVNNHTALDSLLKYIDKGSVKELSNYQDRFLFVESLISDKKTLLNQLRKDMNITTPEYEVIIKPEGTHAIYVKAKDAEPETVFGIIHSLRTTVDSGVSTLWIYSPDAVTTKGKRPDESIDPLIEYITQGDEINYFNGQESTTLYDLMK